jgi:hypothetical protein
MKPTVPPAFAGFDLHRYRVKKDWPKDAKEPTAEECVQSCWANMQTAAAELAKARAIYDGLQPGAVGVFFAVGEMNRLRAEQRHWRGLMDWHRARARTTAPDRRVAREPGSDDE